MKRRALIVLIAAAGLLAPPSVAAATSTSTLQSRLDAVHAAGMPGALAEVRDGRRTERLSTGVADVKTGSPVRAGMRHRVGSVTKSFVATTVLQLAGEGRIRLDAPVRRYLSFDIDRKVTVRQLLNHTSGIGDYDTELVTTPESILELGRRTFRPAELVELGLAAPPTTGYSYSNTNYILAGLIIEKVTGRSYRTEVSRRILKPLGLRDTYFEGADPFIRGPHMNAYVPWTDGELKDLTKFNMTWAGSAGEMVSTARDLNVFYRALLTGTLLPARLLAEMKTTGTSGYGLGLSTVQLPCGAVWGHDGGTFGHQTISWHTADGKKQVTYAQSMAFYQTSPDEPHPIDVAAQTFLVTAICGEQAAGAATPGTFERFSG